MSYFYTPWKCQITKSFLKFSEGIVMGPWREKGLMGELEGVARTPANI